MDDSLDPLMPEGRAIGARSSKSRRRQAAKTTRRPRLSRNGVNNVGMGKDGLLNDVASVEPLACTSSHVEVPPCPFPTGAGQSYLVRGSSYPMGCTRLVPPDLRALLTKRQTLFKMRSPCWRRRHRWRDRDHGVAGREETLGKKNHTRGEKQVPKEGGGCVCGCS